MSVESEAGAPPQTPDRCEKCNAVLVASDMCIECGHIHGVPAEPVAGAARSRCKASTRRGWPCQAFVSGGVEYCYGHSAQRIRELEAVAKGAAAPRSPEEWAVRVFRASWLCNDIAEAIRSALAARDAELLTVLGEARKGADDAARTCAEHGDEVMAAYYRGQRDGINYGRLALLAAPPEGNATKGET